TGVMGQHDFGAALRWLRERTEPAAVGLPAGGRRARGLRREELAELAGVSADYVRRLEQGRSHPSAGVVNAIARALRVGRAEYERLCALAGHAATDGRVPCEVGAGAVRLLERLDGTAVCLCDAAWNVVAFNDAWTALACGVPTGHAWGGNVAWRTFGNTPSRVSRTGERAAGFEAMLAARLHSASLRYPADASLTALVDELRSTSRTFDTLWHTARTVAAHEDRAVLRHPDGGDVTLDCDLLAIPGDDLLAMIFTAGPGPGSADAARLGEIVGGAHKPAAVRVGQAGPG
ncbi:MAG: helix-turn-helix domain-containing protein, partial [Pseudonocardiaceae bacterium]